MDDVLHGVRADCQLSAIALCVFCVECLIVLWSWLLVRCCCFVVLVVGLFGECKHAYCIQQSHALFFHWFSTFGLNLIFISECVFFLLFLFTHFQCIRSHTQLLLYSLHCGCDCGRCYRFANYLTANRSFFLRSFSLCVPQCFRYSSVQHHWRCIYADWCMFAQTQ